MTSPTLPLATLKYKSPKKTISPEILPIQYNNTLNVIQEFSKLRDNQLRIKNKKSLKTKLSGQEFTKIFDGIKAHTSNKKGPDSPRMYSPLADKLGKAQDLLNFYQLSKEPKLSSQIKAEPTENWLISQAKSKLGLEQQKSQAGWCKKQVAIGQKPRVKAVTGGQKVQENKKNYLGSPRFSDQISEDANYLKKSRNLENEKEGGREEEKILFNKELKETISTTSSNKAFKNIKISDFQIGRDLGKGKFGNVRIVRHKKTGMLFSIKIINKQMVKQQNIIDQLIKEIKIQNFLNHSHIVKIYSVFDDLENVYLLMELCCEGNLYEHMQRIGKIEQQQASCYLKEICEAVKQLHYNKIIHRDIKPQNIVLCFGMLKICDFGWSTQIKGSMRETFCGSPLYISPELLKGQLYDEKVDLWSLGILGYEMLTGTIPFQIVTERDLGKIISSKITYPSQMSKTATSFLQQLLERNPENRSSIDQLMTHPFISRS